MIREYQSSDWLEICRIYDSAKPHELSTADIAASFIPLAMDERRIAQFTGSKIFVWEDEDCIRAFAGFNGNYIGWLFVEPETFRNGIGKALLRHILNHIDGEPWLWSMKNNHAAMPCTEPKNSKLWKKDKLRMAGCPVLL